MARLTYRFIPAGKKTGQLVPLGIALVDIRTITSCGCSVEDAIRGVACDVNAPVAINIFDMDAVTTTSDGIVIDGAIVCMGAGDNGNVNEEFGILSMARVDVTDDLIKEEPHLAQVKRYYPGKPLYRGPDPAKKLIPVHNVVMTGRAANNNSATEMMDIVTMEEILFPILGQIQIMKDKPVVVGMSGEYISVGVGMTVAEVYGRIFPTRQFRAGDTAHAAERYAKNLKSHIPCIVAPKRELARSIIRAFECGMVPGRELGCAPACIAVAQAYHHDIDIDNITEKAEKELASIGMDIRGLSRWEKPLPKEQIIGQADRIIPGVVNPVEIEAHEIAETRSVDIVSG
ncbi:MAG: hypothetical protein GF401_15190 [Chitinivibrionales bacterium]|nr:hypothetical protein [Chitinivibrionales bacterium]